MLKLIINFNIFIKLFNLTAKTNYEKVLALDKENVKALMALADIVLDNAKNPDGVSDPNSAIDEKVLLYGKKLTELFPSDKDGFIYAGEASYKLTDYNGANKYFKRAMELKPDASEKKSINSMSFNCYLTLGKNYLSGKKYAEAEKNFNEAKKIDSKNKDLKAGLADCYLEKGKTLYLAGDYSGAGVCFNNIKDFNIGGKVTTQADDYISKIADATKSSEPVYIDNNT